MLISYQGMISRYWYYHKWANYLNNLILLYIFCDKYKKRLTNKLICTRIYVNKYKEMKSSKYQINRDIMVGGNDSADIYETPHGVGYRNYSRLSPLITVIKFGYEPSFIWRTYGDKYREIFMKKGGTTKLHSRPFRMRVFLFYS